MGDKKASYDPLPLDCIQRDTKYYKRTKIASHWVRTHAEDMEGQHGSFEKTPRACQERCKATPGCRHFSFFNGLLLDVYNCHLQDADAVAGSPASTPPAPPNAGEIGINWISGPPEC